MSVRVCHVTSVHPADDVRIFHRECVSLAHRRGNDGMCCYEVHLVAPNVADGERDGVKVHGVELPSGRLQRQLFLDRVYRRAIEVDAAVYHLHDPELLDLGLRLKRHGKRVIFDSHEDVPGQLLTKEYLPVWSRKPISRFYTIMEQERLKRYDAVVTVTPSIAERLRRVNENCVMVTNFPVYADTPHQWKEREERYVCFAGGVDERYMHENIIESLRYTRARYLLAGRCFMASYWQRLQSLEMWKKVEYLGVLPPERVNEVYQRADVGLVLLDYSPNVGYHKGTLGVLKLFEYMMAGIPVVATDFELWKEIVEGEDCGLCVNPHDVQAIAKAVNYLLDNPDRARLMGENGRKAVRDKYNWATQEQALYGLYDSLVNR